MICPCLRYKITRLITRRGDGKDAYQFVQFTCSSVRSSDAVVALNHVEVVICRVSDELPWGVRERHRILLQLGAQLWDLEDATADHELSI
jgi:hypothetical protein